MASPQNTKDAGEEFVDKLTGDIIVDATGEIDASQDAKKDGDNNGDDAQKSKEESADGSASASANDNADASAADKKDGADADAATDSAADSAGVFAGKKFFLNRAPDALDTVHEANKLQEIIVANGGEVLAEEPKENEDGTFIVSPYNITKLPTVTPTYIKASADNANAPDINNYLVPFDEFRASSENKDKAEGEGEGEDATASAEADASADAAVKASNSQKEDDDELNLFHDAMDTTPDQTSNLVEDTGATAVADENAPAQSESTTSSATEQAKQYSAARMSMPRPPMHSHNKASFTEDEDEFILDVVRKNPTRRTTHTLFDEISHYVPNHTGNSIRHRFRVYLSKRLEFVYKVDNVGKLIRDESGNLIKTEVLPPSLKRKFIAEEDYMLAMAIKRQFYRDLYQIDPESGSSLINNDDTPTAIAKRNMTMDPNHIPGHEPTFEKFRTEGRRGPIAREFFKNFAEDEPSHTENAWRDRFRKFLLVYGLDEYIDYYEGEVAANRPPQPIKNMTNRPKREGTSTPGNYNSSIKRHKGADGSESSRGGNDEHGRAMNVAAAAAAAAASEGGMGAHNQRNYPIPENELLDEETMNFISTLKNNLGNIDNTLPFEYPQEIAEAIRHDFSTEEAEYDNIDPDTIPFPPEIATIDLFLPTFFQMSSTREFMQKINDVISRDYEPSQAEKLVQDLCDEAGVRKTFSTSILTALSGDLMVFPRYFLNSFKHNANPPMNVPGIWTREDDEMLRAGKPEDMKLLEKKHGSGRIEMRRRFIEKDLV